MSGCAARQAHTSVSVKLGKARQKNAPEDIKSHLGGVCRKPDTVREFTELVVYALLPPTRFIRRYSVTTMPAIEQKANRCHGRYRSGRIF